MYVNGQRVARTSATHVWVRGVRYELRWETREHALVSNILSLRVVMVVEPLGLPCYGSVARVFVDGLQRHRSEHGSATVAQRACAKATRRALELNPITPPL